MKEVDRETDAHDLEDRRCTGVKPTRLVEIGQRMASLTSPPLSVDVKPVPGRGYPTSFVIRVRESSTLVAWKDSPSGYCRYSTRRFSATIPMESPEVEFVARHKAAVRENVEFRHEMLGVIEELFYDLLERPGEERPEGWSTWNSVLTANPYDIGSLNPRGLYWPLYDQVRRLVLEMPKKIGAFYAVTDAARAIRELAQLDKDLPHTGLAAEEYRLMAAARRLRPDEEFEERLDTFRSIRVFAGTHADRLWSDFTSGYDESFGAAFDRLAPTTGNSNFDEGLKRQTVHELVGALSLILPLAFGVLRLYGQFQSNFGPTALGIEE